MTQRKQRYRTGPRPLSAHIGLAADLCTKENSSLTPVQLQAMVEGIKKYQSYPHEARAQHYKTVWKNGQAALRYHAPKDMSGAAIFLIPSMINGSEIFDIHACKSFAQYCAGQGYHTYVLDWGKPVRDAQAQTLEGAITTHAYAALSHIAQKHDNAPHVLGYCMGGLVALALANLYPNVCGSLTLLATPWNFKTPQDVLAQRVAFWRERATALINEKTYLPADVIQMMFASVAPEKTVQKFMGFAAMAMNSRQADLFVAAEDWLNNGEDIPGAIASFLIHDAYGRNITHVGQWYVAGKKIMLQHVQCPLMIVAGKKDVLVPPESSLALAQGIENATVFEPDCGHISLMAGRRAEDDVWADITGFMAAHNNVATHDKSALA